MSEPFVGEIEIFGFNFPPKGWALCQGQLLPISQNTALFSLLGTNFGGDGRSTFGLPNLQGSVPVGMGQGTGLSEYVIGETGGTQNVTLLPTQLAAHTHTLPASSADGKINTPAASTVMGATGSIVKKVDSYATSASGTMAAPSVGTAGSNNPHNNMSSYVTVNYCIALQGIFPTRN